LPGHSFIAPTDIETSEGVTRLASSCGDEEFAQILYSSLREVDVQELSEVIVYSQLVN
jgi:hypothetical protein